MSPWYDKILPLIERKKMDTMQTVDIDQINAQIESYRNKVNNLQSQVNQIIDNLTEDYWFNDSTDKEDVLRELCDIIGHEAKKEVTFTATFKVTGRVDIPLGEDYDLSDILSDGYVDINNGDVVIDDTELYDVREDY